MTADVCERRTDNKQPKKPTPKIIIRGTAPPRADDTTRHDRTRHGAARRCTINEMPRVNPTEAPQIKGDCERCSKLKRSVLLGALIVLAILAWQYYENYLYHKATTDEESLEEHEIIDLTQQLYADELTQSPYVAGVHFQGRTMSNGRHEQAPHPLLQLHDDQLATDTTSTVYLMKRLFDNYHLDTLVVEQVTAAEEQEELDFLNGLMQTHIMKRTMRFLHQKGVVSKDYDAQMQLLKNIWFLQYSRGHGRVGSSGFEHVFLAELLDHNILGLHNWIYFGEQERLGHLHYKGLIKRVHLGKGNHYLAAVRFTFHDRVKSYNTLLIGTSPELEISLYTICFLLSKGKPCPVQLGRTKFNIITHAWDWRGKKTLATAYPSIE